MVTILKSSCATVLFAPTPLLVLLISWHLILSLCNLRQDKLPVAPNGTVTAMSKSKMAMKKK